MINSLRMALFSFLVTIIVPFMMVAAENRLLRELPPITCSEADPNHNQCMLNFLQEAKPVFLRGIPKLNLPNLNPLRLKNFTIGYDLTDRIGFKIFINKLEVFGLKDVNFLKYNKDPANLKVTVSVEVPPVNMKLEYNITVNALGKTMTTGGATEIDIGRFHKSFEFSYSKTLRSGQKDIDVKLLEDDFKIEDVKVQIFNDNPIYQTEINRGLATFDKNRGFVSDFLLFLLARRIADFIHKILHTLINGRSSLDNVYLFDN